MLGRWMAYIELRATLGEPCQNNSRSLPDDPLSSPYNAEYVHAGGLLSAGSYGGFTALIRTGMDGYCLSVDVQIHYLI